MNLFQKILLLILSVLLSVPLAAGDKTSVASETQTRKDIQNNENLVAKKLNDEEEILKELRALNYAELALLKAGYKEKNNGRPDLPSYECSEFKFVGISKKESSHIQLQSDLAAVRDSVTVALGKKAPNLDFNAMNEPTVKVDKYFNGGILWAPHAWAFDSGMTRCEKTSGIFYKYECKTNITPELFAFLDKKLKDDPKFLDDRINEKK